MVIDTYPQSLSPGVLANSPGTDDANTLKILSSHDGQSVLTHTLLNYTAHP